MFRQGDGHSTDDAQPSQTSSTRKRNNQGNRMAAQGHLLVHILKQIRLYCHQLLIVISLYCSCNFFSHFSLSFAPILTSAVFQASGRSRIEMKPPQATKVRKLSKTGRFSSYWCRIPAGTIILLLCCFLEKNFIQKQQSITSPRNKNGTRAVYKAWRYLEIQRIVSLLCKLWLEFKVKYRGQKYNNQLGFHRLNFFVWSKQDATGL